VLGDIFIADRFLCEGRAGWRDLATGLSVALTVAPFDPRRHGPAGLERERALSGPPGGAMTRDAMLVDSGRTGLGGWFEARTACGPVPRIVPVRIDDLLRDVRTRLNGAASMSGGRIILAGQTAQPAISVALALARSLRAEGLVAVRPTLALPHWLVAHLCRRHLALLLLASVDRERAGGWLRLSVRTSRRECLVIDLQPPTSRCRTGVPARVGPSAQGRTSGPLAGGRLAARAARQAARGRHAAAERWWRAALSSAVRHGHQAAAAQAADALIELLTERDAWAEAGVLARSLDRSGIVSDAAAAALLIAGGDLPGAAVRLRVHETAAAAARRPLHDAVPIRRAELLYWQGNVEAAERLVAPLALTPDVSLLRGLAAWGRRDGAALRAITGEAAGGGNHEVEAMAVVWRHLAAVCDGRPVVEPGGQVQEALRRLHARRPARLLRAVLSEAQAIQGHCERALRALGPRHLWRRGPVLDRLLFDWMSAQWRGASSAAVRRAIDRTGAVGITRWAAGGTAMHLLRALPAVLQLVHDAEDEQAALAAACSWARQSCGADAAAFIDPDHAAVVAGVGWSRGVSPRALADAGSAAVPTADGRVMVQVAVRYSGATIGAVVVRGPGTSLQTLREGAETLAVLGAPALRARLDALVSARQGQVLLPEIIGTSLAIAGLRDAVARAAATPFAVLIEGESGTGKELVARAIHRLSARRDRRWTAINCAALTDDLLEAELFGHARGAFTGALSPRAGLFEDADGGTLFLDEVGELSPRAQAKLLRVLQEREVRRVGENAARPVDVRLVSATNRVLTEAAAAGAFREDLRFRLAVIRIRLAPLRDRPEDVPRLAQTFWGRLLAQTDKRAVLSPDALGALLRHRWPGNVRELQNVMAALVVLAPARGRVSARHVAQVLTSATSGAPDEREVLALDRERSCCELQAIAAALARHGGRRAAAARALGLCRHGLATAI
jgi:DNA-binding NtrC family response regulator